jgi:hypothetical protein
MDFSLFQIVQMALGPVRPPTQSVPGFFPGDKATFVMNVTTHLQLLARLRMGIVTHLLPLYAFTVRTGKKLYLFTLFCMESCLFVERNLIKVHVEKLLYTFLSICNSRNS